MKGDRHGCSLSFDDRVVESSDGEAVHSCGEHPSICWFPSLAYDYYFFLFCFGSSSTAIRFEQKVSNECPSLGESFSFLACELVSPAPLLLAFVSFPPSYTHDYARDVPTNRDLVSRHFFPCVFFAPSPRFVAFLVSPSSLCFLLMLS